MKFCPNCSKERNYKNTNCECGFHFPFKNKFFTPDDKHINTFLNKKSNKKRTYLGLMVLVSIISLGFCFNLFPESIIFAGIISLILIFYAFGVHLNSHQYHSLPDSLTKEGEHQCLFCGNLGIYRSSPYKTNITECRCSKCKEHLFNE